MGAMALPYAHDIEITVRVNGRAVRAVVRPRTTLLDWLREEVGLTGTKKGCNQGACGACTVLVDGQRMNGCLTLAVQCDGREITTVEGLANGDGLSPVQAAFRDCDAFQCGACTAGQVMSAVALLDEVPRPTADQVRELMSGNLCRCGAYPRIVDAVPVAAGSDDAGQGA